MSENGVAECSDRPLSVVEENGFDSAAASGDWLVDNTVGVHSGMAAIHAGSLHAGDEASFTFDCAGKDHTQLAFQLKAGGSSTRQLTLLVDGQPREVFVGDGAWRPQIIDVPRGQHEYQFTASVSQDSDSPFQLDTFKCVDQEPCNGPNGNVSFDAGFIPPEALNEGGEWFVGNTQGVHMGDAAISAPNLRAGDTKSFKFDCGGRRHSQLSFYLKAAGSSTRQLKFLVDGVPREVFVGDGVFRQQLIDVTQGTHAYEFVATSDENTSSPFQLDSFVCRDVDPEPGPNGNISFDLGFVPPEVVDSCEGWAVGNTQGVQSGEAAISAPNMLNGDEKSFSFECADEHTQLRFYLKGAGSSTRQLRLLVDGEDREVFVGDGLFREQIIDVPAGKHRYQFTATTAQDTSSPFQLDSFVCRNVEARPGQNGAVSFDLGFIPVEALSDGGEWFVGSTQGVQAGEAAIGAPNMKAGDKKTFTFDCAGAEHTQLSFYLKGTGSSTRQLELRVDGHEREVFVGDGIFRQQFINVAEGAHEYEFIATTTEDTTSPFQLDSFLCRHIEPALGPNGNVSFDLGFIPPEVLEQGGDWFVGGTQGTQAGEAAISAPPLLAGEKKQFTFDCGGVEHSRLTFYLKAGGASSRSLALSVDGELHEPFVGDGIFRQQVIDSDSVSRHKYVFTATAAADTPSPFQLDTFVCSTP